MDGSMAFNGAASYKVDWTFVDGDLNRWLRLSTFNTPNGPNPLIRFDQGSEATVRIKAITEPVTALLLGTGAVLFARRRRPI